MTSEEAKRIVEVAASSGVSRIKITGGEPLLRNDICELISYFHNIPGIEEISMTTNGTLFADFARDLKGEGLGRVNIGLSSLNPEIYRKVTGADKVEDVKKGLVAAVEAGLTPVKLNMVVLKGLNDGEIGDMIDFAGRSYILQLIELERQGAAVEAFEKYYTGLDEIERQLRSRSDRVEVRSLNNRQIFHLKGEGPKVELVRPFHNSDFCRNCTRMRLTSSGKLKPCLMKNDNLVDILSLIREGASEDILKRTFAAAVLRREPYYLADQ
jgi:cyclic pyranopterin phosphate synthase